MRSGKIIRAEKAVDSLVALGGACALLLWAAPVRETIATLAATTEAVARNPPSFRRALRTPGAGIEVLLPATILQAVMLLERTSSEHYRLSALAATDGWFSQQTETLAWPRRPSNEPASPTLFVREPLPDQCVTIDRTKDVVLARCP